MTRHRIGVGGVPEGHGRKWGRPPHVPETPMCIVKVDWPKCKDEGLRLDLDAVAFAEYIVGANAGRPGAAGNRGVASNAKGLGSQPVALFCSHPEISDTKFSMRWLKRDPALGGQDGSRWTLQQAWAVHLLRQPLHAKRFRKSSREQNQFRIRLCPEPNAGLALASAGRMEEFARRFMSGLERDFSDEAKIKAHFIWTAGAHFNTDNPHVHIGMRGITVEGDHVYFSQQYLRPTRKELEKNPCASSPIDWRARGVLAEMLNPEKSVRHAG